jgi:hypothetical protein
LLEQPRGICRIAVIERGATVSSERPEAGRIELTGLHDHLVARVTRDNAAIPGQAAPHVAHPDAQRGLRVGRRILAPQGVDQKCPGRRLVRMQQQDCQRAALRRAPEHQRRAIIAFGQ